LGGDVAAKRDIAAKKIYSLVDLKRIYFRTWQCGELAKPATSMVVPFNHRLLIHFGATGSLYDAKM